MANEYEWLIKKTPRSVDQLRLWAKNPRLNPQENHISLRDFAEDLIRENADKEEFKNLVKSIVQDGFVPADPIVVWQNPNNEKYYVAEGNRRVIALKLLRNPNKAPTLIRSFIKGEARKININTIEKIPVNIAPSFKDAEWYINQRNSATSLQRRWTRIQQQRWIQSLYEKYDGNIDLISNITKLNKSSLEGFIRILKIRDYIKESQVKDKLTTDEFEKAYSYKFPITILERIFSFSETRAAWGIRFNGTEVDIISNKNEFYALFAELIKRIINKSNEDIINTRLNKEDLPKLFETLPHVSLEQYHAEENEANPPTSSPSEKDNTQTQQKKSTKSESETTRALKKNPDRNTIIIRIYNLTTENYKLQNLFKELKKMPFRYPNAISASIRIFLDLAVLEYIRSENLENDIKKTYQNDLKNIQLKLRLEYIKNHLPNKQAKTIIDRLINPQHEYSLDVLNGYMHSDDSHYSSKQFLNRFWDFLFPLFQNILTINEDDRK